MGECIMVVDQWMGLSTIVMHQCFCAFSWNIRMVTLLKISYQAFGFIIRFYLFIRIDKLYRNMLIIRYWICFNSCIAHKQISNTFQFMYCIYIKVALFDMKWRQSTMMGIFEYTQSWNNNFPFLIENQWYASFIQIMHIMHRIRW